MHNFLSKIAYIFGQLTNGSQMSASIERKRRRLLLFNSILRIIASYEPFKLENKTMIQRKTQTNCILLKAD